MYIIYYSRYRLYGPWWDHQKNDHISERPGDCVEGLIGGESESGSKESDYLVARPSLSLLTTMVSVKTENTQDWPHI